MTSVERWARRALAWALSRRLVRAVLHYVDHRGGLLAAAVTFRAVFSILAAVFVGFSVAGIWISSRDDLWTALIESVDSVIPGLIGIDGRGGVVDADQLGSALPGTVGFSITGAVALGALIWAAVSAIANLRTSLRMLAGTAHDDVLIVWLYLRDLVFAVSVGALFALTAVLTFLGTTFADAVLGWLGLTGGGWAALLTRTGTIVTTFALDAVIIAWLFRLLSGRSVRSRQLWQGAFLGGAGLIVLQQLSGLFVGGATRNPLLASSVSIFALLLWFNFSAQVILIASAYIVVAADEAEDRVGERHGARTLAQRRVRSAERDARLALDALEAARENERMERARLASRLS